MPRFLILSILSILSKNAPAKTFDVDISTGRPAAANEAYYHGETIEFRAVRGRSAVTNVEYGCIYYQTNGMDRAWWKTDGLVFHPTNDVGAANYRFFLEGRDDLGRDWHANGLLRLLPSPGFTPNGIEPPVQRLDFANIDVANAPYYTKAETDAAIAAIPGGADLPLARGEGANSLVRVDSDGDRAEATGTGAVALGAPGTDARSRASGDWSFTEGGETVASGNCSHAEGSVSEASGYAAHAEGGETSASGNYSHAEGLGCGASGEASHAEGWMCEAVGDNSHASGRACRAVGLASHAMGVKCEARDEGQVSVGIYPQRQTDGVHSPSRTTVFAVGAGDPDVEDTAKTAMMVDSAGDVFMHGVGGYDGEAPAFGGARSVQDVLTNAAAAAANAVPFANAGKTSVAVGNGNDLNGKGSSAAFGAQNNVGCGYALAAGFGNTLGAAANGTFAAGYKNTVDGKRNLVAGGANTTAATSPGANTVSGNNNIVAGRLNDVRGDNSLVVGEGNETSEDNAIVCGRFATPVHYTDEDDTGARTPRRLRLAVGVGNDADSRTNALIVDEFGNVYIQGVGGYGGNAELHNAQSLQETLSALAGLPKPLAGLSMPAAPSQQQLVDAVQRIWRALGGTVE